MIEMTSAGEIVLTISLTIATLVIITVAVIGFRQMQKEISPSKAMKRFLNNK